MKATSPGKLVMHHGHGECRFGSVCIAWCEEGITRLGFVPKSRRAAWLKVAAKAWPDTDWEPAQKEAERLVGQVFSGKPPKGKLALLLKGTPFQLDVWKALLGIPPGHTADYKTVAAAVGRPSAVRAVGTAVGANPIAWLIPCHRVLPAGGGVGGYAWGAKLKQAILQSEQVWPE